MCRLSDIYKQQQAGKSLDKLYGNNIVIDTVSHYLVLTVSHGIGCHSEPLVVTKSLAVADRRVLYWQTRWAQEDNTDDCMSLCL